MPGPFFFVISDTIVPNAAGRVCTKTRTQLYLNERIAPKEALPWARV